MEVIKISNLKTVKQTIELDLQGKIKLDIYESLYQAYTYESTKIFDLLIKTYYKSIDFNKQINSRTILYYMIEIRSKCLNFILNNLIFNLDLYNIKNIIWLCSYKSFKFLLSKIDNLDVYYIFQYLCKFTTLGYIKLFISKYNVKDLILKKDSYGYTPLDCACFNQVDIVKYLLKFIDPKLINPNLINVKVLFRNLYKENNIKYLLENFKFNLNKQNEYGYTIMHYIEDLNIAKMLFKYDGNIDLEIKNGFNYTAIENTNYIKIYKFLAKYTKPYNIIFENPEIFKSINKN